MKVVKRILAMTLLAGAMSASVAWAGAGDEATIAGAAKNPVVTWSIKINAQLPDGSGTAGPCTGGAGFANHCPSKSCTCYTSTGTVSGTAGNGTVTFYETFDDGNEVDQNLSVTCRPAWGDIEIMGSKDTESIGWIGGDCFANPFSTSPFTNTEVVNGGCELNPSKLFLGGWAACSGSYGALKGGNFPLKLTIKGKAWK